MLYTGISISLNSDDPLFFKTTLAEKYDRAQQFYQYSDEQMLNITGVAINDAFVNADKKVQLMTLSD